MSILLCALTLISPNRPTTRIGTVVTQRYEQSGRCIEDMIKVGKTWLEDEILWRYEVNAGPCP